ncbi:hypothetical protein [Engelhardtia mirabilis]|uniref:Cortical protein marker for cell polarity n=1 Tax=Engelhardtia mirabilis TaxID=2528011 RepID=A0A518BNI4_9BACT|nr:hypothetical protein Pla133_36400 [Planctomycetes bacterium Pla133]QDV02867.1 hypothetical protein Pla86_36380 [Planctomycetes bacterium Pla86]
MKLHRSRTAGLTLASIALIGAPAQAQSWSEEFDLPGVAGRVFSTSSWQDQLVVGGYDYLQADAQSLGLVATFDGTSWSPLGSGIPGAGAFVDYDVRDFAIYDGGLVAAGTFTSAGGQPAKSIALFDGVDWQPLGGGLDLSFAPTGSVFSLEVFQGDLYASGQFNLAGGIPVQGLARWDGQQWHAVGGGLPPVAGGTPGFAWEMSVGPDGLLYLAGEFPAAGGVAATGNIATWDGSNFASVGGGFNVFGGASVRDLAWYDGELWAVGTYDLAAGGAGDEKAAIFDGSTWRAAGNFPDSAVGTRLDAICVFQDQVYVGGNIVSVDGLSVRRMARFDGTSWTSPGGIFAQSINQFVFDMVAIDGTLWVGGEFSSVGYLPPAGEVIVTNSVGAFDGSSWSGGGKGLGVNGPVRASLDWNGATVAFGDFNQAGDQQVDSVALLDGDNWFPLGTFNGAADGGTVFQNDLVVVGNFTSVDGVSTPAPAARFDGTTWHSLGSGAMANAVAAAVYGGELYALADFGLWRLEGSTWNQVGMSIFGAPYALHVHGDLLLVGGSYGFGQGNVLAWDGQTLASLGGGTDDAVRAFASLGDDLYVGGEFGTAGGVQAPLLARWSDSGWSGVGPLTGTEVTALAALGGELFVGGNLFVPGNPANKYIARLAGGSFEALGTGMVGQPLTMTTHEQSGSLDVGGIFQSAGGAIAHNFSRWDTGVSGPVCQADLGFGGPGQSVLTLCGTGLGSGQSSDLRLTGAAPAALGVLAVGLVEQPTPLFAGILVAGNPVLTIPLATDAAGEYEQLGLAGGHPLSPALFLQALVINPSVPGQVEFSNGILAQFQP